MSQFTTWKVRFVRYLHEHLGFDVVAFESGFHECREAEERATSGEPRAVLQRCLIVQLHHTELLPLFEYSRSTRQTQRPLRIAGTDFQIQSFATRTRPRWYRGALQAAGFPLADTLATLDSVLIERTFQPVDTWRAWLRDHATSLKALYDSAAAFASGDLQWSLLGASELMRRELLRLDALARNQDPPASVYEARDQWMARSIERAAGGSPGGPRKVVVWLHNDHARYGGWEVGSTTVGSAGQFLRERHGDDVFSIGLIAGSGAFADNFRRVREIAPPDSIGLEAVFSQAGHRIGWLLLNAPRDPSLSRWATTMHTYSRGDVRRQMQPAREFDALVYFDSVSPATYIR